MNFDFGEVLGRAWQISWKRRTLWVIGILFGFLVSMMFPLMFSPLLFPFLMQESRRDLAFLFLGGILLAFFLFILVLYPVSVLVQTSLTLSILDAEQEAEQTSVSELLKRSLPFFWRVLGLMLLFALGMTVTNLLIQVVVFSLAILTLGIGMMCVMPLMLLYYPFLYAAIVWMEQAMNGIIIDKLPVMEAARQGWRLLRNHPLPFALLALIIYFGIGMVTGVVMVPVMMPLFALPFGFTDHDVNWIIVSISILSVLVFIPLFAILIGWSMIFSKSAWVLTYLRLTRGTQLQPLAVEGTA